MTTLSISENTFLCNPLFSKPPSPLVSVIPHPRDGFQTLTIMVASCGHFPFDCPLKLTVMTWTKHPGCGLTRAYSALLRRPETACRCITVVNLQSAGPPSSDCMNRCPTRPSVSYREIFQSLSRTLHCPPLSSVFLMRLEVQLSWSIYYTKYPSNL